MKFDNHIYNLNDSNINVKIAVATHKSYKMPKDAMYVPFLAGAEGQKEDYGYMRDDITDDNISYKNPSFCELTVLYEAVRVLDAEYIGLVHYRRHFAKNGFSSFNNIIIRDQRTRFESVLTYEELKYLLPRKRLILPKKRNYMVETIYSHYAHTHSEGHLLIAREVIGRMCKGYLRSFDKVMKSHTAYMFNMMIMQRDLLKKYYDWLFPVVFELENTLTASGIADNLDDYNKRLYGRVSEILFNVWLDKMLSTGVIKRSEVAELPFIYMENVNVLRKVASFAGAKLLGRKYNKSF